MTVAKVKEEPADYAKALGDFASAQAETAAENMAAFAEIAKKLQTETVELMMAAGKDMSEEASAAVQKSRQRRHCRCQKGSRQIICPPIDRL